MPENPSQPQQNPFLLRGQQRGVIISNPIAIEDQAIRVIAPSIDEQELRFALLYWDKLAWPQSSVLELLESPEAEFLMTCGLLIRPECLIEEAYDLADIVRREFMLLFEFCEMTSPGAWSLAQGDKSLLIESPIFSPGRGILVQLHRAIPTPDKEMPLQEILEFKEKRADQLARLRQRLDELYVKVANATDSFFEFGKVAREIDLACVDVLRVAKESRFPFRFTDLSITYDPSVGRMAVPAFSVGVLTEFSTPLVLASAFLASLNCNLKISPARGIALASKRASPYNFVASYHGQFL